VTEAALNHDGEPLHTGDDERIDAVTNIRASVEELRDDPDLDASDIIHSVLEECATLDRLLIETIQRERAAREQIAALPNPLVLPTATKSRKELEVDAPDFEGHVLLAISDPQGEDSCIYLSRESARLLATWLQQQCQEGKE
jgi:hypothetical protein